MTTRVRPAFRWLAIIAVIVLTPFAAHALWDYVELRRLIAEIERIQASGEPVNRRQAGLEYDKLSEQQARASRYYMAAGELGESRGAFEPTRTWKEWLVGATATAPDRSALAVRLRAVVDESADTLRLVDMANALDFHAFDVSRDYAARPAKIASLSAVVSARTLYFSLADRGDDAARSALSSLRLQRALADSPWFGPSSHAVSSVLSLSKPSDDLLARLDQSLAAEIERFSLERELLGERASYLTAIWRRYYGADPSSPQTYLLPRRSLMETVWRPWFTRQSVATLRTWSELIAAARKPWPEKATIMAAVRHKIPPADVIEARRFVPPRGIMAAVFWASSDATLSGVGGHIDNLCSRAAVAIERYRRDHDDEIPSDLNELSPRYLAKVPIDPFSGAALGYKRDRSAYIIYSVGPDQKDDGGDLTFELRQTIERGWGFRRARGRDMGVRVLIH
jgi:hypothetical protein